MKYDGRVKLELMYIAVDHLIYPIPGQKKYFNSGLVQYGMCTVKLLK